MKELLTSKIIRVSIGKNFTSDWNVEGDKKALLLTRKSISTKLKLARPFVIEDGRDKLDELLHTAVTGITDEECGMYFISSEFLPFDTSISKENYNVLLRKKKDENKLQITSDDIDSLLILDISNDVKLIRYMSDYEIMNSYHSGKTDTPSYGCFIKLPSVMEADVEICRLQTFENGKFYQYIITADDIKRFEINKPASIEKLKKIKTNMNKSKIPVGFKVTPKVFPTKFVISMVKDEDEQADMLEKIRSLVTSKFPETENDPLAIILLNDKQTNQEIIDDLNDIFNDPQYSNSIAIRAITTYECKLDYNITKAMKFNYIFSLDTTGNLKTIKSN